MLDGTLDLVVDGLCMTTIGFAGQKFIVILSILPVLLMLYLQVSTYMYVWDLFV
jgi:hypothetical protein